MIIDFIYIEGTHTAIVIAKDGQKIRYSYGGYEDPIPLAVGNKLKMLFKQKRFGELWNVVKKYKMTRRDIMKENLAIGVIKLIKEWVK